MRVVLFSFDFCISVLVCRQRFTSDIHDWFVCGGIFHAETGMKRQEGRGEAP